MRLKLTKQQDPDMCLTGPYFRLTGGVVWDGLEHGLIASYVGGAWKHRTRLYTDLYFEGNCCLMTGIARDPKPISGVLECISISGAMLFADGVQLARYDELRDMWCGTEGDVWWPALRIVNTDLFPITVENVRLDPPSVAPGSEASSTSADSGSSAAD